MNESDLVVRRQAELRLRVGDHLDPEETLRAAVWIARDSRLPLIMKVTRWEGAPQGLPGLGGFGPMVGRPAGPAGPAGSMAAGLDRHVPEPTAAAALALTDARLLLFLIAESPAPSVDAPSVDAPSAGDPPAGDPPTGLFDRIRLAGRRVLGRGEPAPLPPLTPVWQCPRTALDAVDITEPEGKLTLRFTDGSGLSVVAPAMLAMPFVRAARHQ